jgi:Erv1 / Alr family
MKSLIWGPYGWYTLHWLAFTLDEKKLPIYHSIFQSLQTILPCPVCRSHYAKQTQVSFPISNIRNRHTAIHWVFHLHNSVNTMLKKKSLSFDQCLRLYFNPNKTPKFEVKHILTFLLCCYHDYIKTKNDVALESFSTFLQHILTVFPFESAKTNQFLQEYPVPKKDQLQTWFQHFFQRFGYTFIDPILQQKPQPLIPILSPNEHQASPPIERKYITEPISQKKPREPWSDIHIDELLKEHGKINSNEFHS